MAVKTWQPAADSSWSVDASWGGTKPAAGDSVVFDATSVKNCTVDENPASLISVTIQVTYTGQIIMGTSSWTLTGNWTWGANCTVSEGTSLVTFITNAAIVTSNGKKFYDVTFNQAATNFSFADAASLHSLTLTAGNFTNTSGALTASGDVNFNGTGTLTLGNITLTGASSTLHFNSTLGTCTATACTTTFNGTTATVLDDDKAINFQALVLGAAAVFTSSGAAASTFINSTTTCTVGAGATLTLNTTTNFSLTGNASFITFLGAYTFNGTGALFFNPRNVTGTTLPAITYGGSGVWTFRVQIAGNTGVTFTGNLNLGTAGFTVLNTAANTLTISMVSYNLTCGTFTCGAVNTVGQVINWGSGSHSIAAFDGTTTNPVYGSGGTWVNFQTSRISCNGNFALGSNHTVDSGSMALTVINTSTITFGGHTLYDITVNAATKTITQSGAGIVHSITVTAGSFTTGANNLTVSGNAAFGGTNITIGSTLTMSGDGVTVSISASGSVTTAACVLVLQGNTTLNLGARTISRLQTTRGKTVYFTAGTSALTITTVNAGDWYLGTSGVCTWRSTVKNTQFTIVAPAAVTVQNMAVRDSNNTGTLITATDSSNLNYGNNTGWLFGTGPVPDPLYKFYGASKSAIAIGIGI